MFLITRASDLDTLSREATLFRSAKTSSSWGIVKTASIFHVDYSNQGKTFSYFSFVSLPNECFVGLSYAAVFAQHTPQLRQKHFPLPKERMLWHNTSSESVKKSHNSSFTNKEHLTDEELLSLLPRYSNIFPVKMLRSQGSSSVIRKKEHCFCLSITCTCKSNLPLSAKSRHDNKTTVSIEIFVVF